MKSFLIGFLFIASVAFSVESFAGYHYNYSASGSPTHYTYSSGQAACDAWASLNNYSGYSLTMGTPNSPNTSGIFSQSCTLRNASNDSFMVQKNVYGITAPEPECESPNVIDPDTGECVAPDTYETCQENGELWDKSLEACVPDCPGGYLNGSCLQGAPIGEPNPSDDPDGCDPSADDYQGVYNGKHYCDGDLPEAPTCPKDQMNWIVTDDAGSGAFVCGAPIAPPEEAGDSETETTTTTTDENGNTTTTTTDDKGNTETTTSDGNGNSTTINNYPGTDSETGGPCTASSVACIETPDTEKGLCKDGGSLCDDVNDIKKAMEKKSDRTAKDGDFGMTEANEKIGVAETELSTGLDTIKSEISGYFDLALTAGDIACGPGVEVLGRTIQICPSAMKDQLAVIAQIVMLMAALISLMIIFR